MSYTLSQVPTRVLLKALGQMRLSHESTDCSTKSIFEKRQHVTGRPAGVVDGQTVFDSVGATQSEVLAELATRPHVPSKGEGKLLRRLQAQTGMSADQLRAHPKYGAQLADFQHPRRRVITPAEAERVAPVVGKGFGSMFKVVK